MRYILHKTQLFIERWQDRLQGRESSCLSCCQLLDHRDSVSSTSSKVIVQLTEFSSMHCKIQKALLNRGPNNLFFTVNSTIRFPAAIEVRNIKLISGKNPCCQISAQSNLTGYIYRLIFRKLFKTFA